MLRCRLCLFATMLLLAGCMGRVPPVKIPTTYPVKGTVLLDGKPLRAGTVILVPEKKTGYRAEGSLNHDGTFSVSAFANQEGTVPGTYVVTVQPKPEPKALAGKGPVKGTHAEKGPPQHIPAKYLNAETSKIEVKVEEHDNDLGVIKLVSEKPSGKKGNK